MTWVLNATGHTPAPDGEAGWEAVEEKLYAELQAVLSKPEYGASSSSLSGNHVSGSPHASLRPLVRASEADVQLAKPQAAAEPALD